MMCDSDYAGDNMTRGSCTDFLIFYNMTSIDWVCKKQVTIETSVFGVEYVAMKNNRIEKLQGLWYELQMMGIPYWTFLYFCQQ